MGGFSLQGKTELAFYEDTVDAPGYQDIVGELAAAGRARVVLKTKSKGGNSSKTRRLVTRQSPPSVGWSSMGLGWWKIGPPKVTILTRWRTFGQSLTTDLSTKKFRTEEGMKKKYVNSGMNSIRPSYTTLFTPYQTVCAELGRLREAQ